MTLPVLNRTLAIFLSPELGFFGFVVPTFKHTPLSSGLFFNCGDRSFRAPCADLPWRRTCINVHLLARDAGVEPCVKVGAAFRSAVATIDGCAARRGANDDCVNAVGLRRRRRNASGMVVGV